MMENESISSLLDKLLIIFPLPEKTKNLQKYIFLAHAVLMQSLIKDRKEKLKRFCGSLAHGRLQMQKTITDKSIFKSLHLKIFLEHVFSVPEIRPPTVLGKNYDGLSSTNNEIIIGMEHNF